MASTRNGMCVTICEKKIAKWAKAQTLGVDLELILVLRVVTCFIIASLGAVIRYRIRKQLCSVGGTCVPAMIYDFMDGFEPIKIKS